MYVSYAIVCGLAEALFARSLYSISHFFLFRTIAAAQYTHLSVLMGIIYGLFTIIDFGLFDSIGPWFSRYTASQRHVRRFFLSQLFISWIPLIIAYLFMLSWWATISWVYIIIGIAEHTKRQLRLFLNLAGYARAVAFTEGLSYFSYVLLIWCWFFMQHAHSFAFLFYALALTSVCGVTILAVLLFHHYRSLPADSTAPVALSALLGQRASCTLANLMTAHGVHTIALPLLARQCTNGAALSCTNAIIAALSTIIYKIVTVAGTIEFNSYSRSTLSLQRMLSIVAAVWVVIIGIAGLVSWHLSSSITSYLLISLGLYAAQSIQHTTKLSLDAQLQSFWYSIIITISSLSMHLLFYAALADMLATTLTALFIGIIMVATFIITYRHASRVHRFGSARRTITDQPPITTISDQPHP